MPIKKFLFTSLIFSTTVFAAPGGLGNLSAQSNPFVMDGQLDSETCNVSADGSLFVKENEGWIYVAQDVSGDADTFVYLGSDPTTTVDANWAKSGKVGTWDFFLAKEGAGTFSSWFNADQVLLEDGTDFAQVRNGSFVEGAIRKSLVSSGDVFVALGVFGTNDGDPLLSQVPAGINADANIDRNEFLRIATGVDPCESIPPTPIPEGITIGAGPQIGVSGGVAWFQEFQDWKHPDCHGLDAVGDSADIAGDGGQNARDLVAVYTRDDEENGLVFFRIDYFDLFLGAEDSLLDTYVLLDFDGFASGTTQWPDGITTGAALSWDLSVAVYSTDFWQVRNDDGDILSDQETNEARFAGAYFRSDLDALEFAVDRTLLTESGWDGVSPFRIQAGTSKDFDTTLTDALPDNGTLGSDDQCPRIQYAYILHGNQSLNPAFSVQQLIYNTAIPTPNGRPTGYSRALETARTFKAPPNIHVSATLLASCMWADRPGTSDPQDGPEFVRDIASFLDGDPSNGEGGLIWGVFSEHIMPFFEGTVNRDSISQNESYLREVLQVPEPDDTAPFWIPERVVRGSTFADLTATGYSYTILDQIDHLRNWFGESEEAANKHRLHRINGVNTFMINDEADRFKFANTDGGLWIDTRRELLDLARNGQDEELVLVFDDWEAYAGRSFLSFDQGTDNPDNFDRTIRWLANKPWVEIVTLEDIASRGWTPLEKGSDTTLSMETYDFLEYATEGSYINWYHGASLEEDFDEFAPWIREDLNERGDREFGALSTYVASEAGSSGGAGTIAQDSFENLFAGTTGSLSKLARLAYSTAIYETAWHDEDTAERCADGTFCGTDTTRDDIAAFAKELQFLNLRRANILAAADAWAATANPEDSAVAESVDVDMDGEFETVIRNGLVYTVFENDGGRMIAGFARDAVSGRVALLVGNLLASPNFDDERETSVNDGNKRLSALTDWYADGGTGRSYVNDVYTATIGSPAPCGPDGSRAAASVDFVSPDTRISKRVTLECGDSRLQVAYTNADEAGVLYVRSGLIPDLENLLTTGQSRVTFADNGSLLELANSETGASVAIDYAGLGNNATYNAVASDGTLNSPRDMAQTHMVELSGAGTFSFDLILKAGAPEAPRWDAWQFF